MIIKKLSHLILKEFFWNQSLDNLVIERVNPLDFYKEEIEASIEDKE